MTDERPVAVLPQVPPLGGSFARGVVAGGRLAVERRLGRAGASLPELAYQVAGVRPDAEHLTAYQHHVGESGSDRLPAGFVHVLAFPLATALMVRADFPLPLVGMVHLANRVEQHAPTTLGDALDLHAHAENLAPHRSGTAVDLVTEARVDGRLVWRGVSTYLAKGVRLAGRPEQDEPRPPFVAPAPTGRWHLDGDTGRRYAEVSGDRNPIHVSALGAKAFGFPRAIAHGMDTAARALAAVGPARGDAFVWSVQFAAPVLLPSSPSVRVARDGAGFGLDVWHARSGRLHLTGRVDPLR